MAGHLQRSWVWGGGYGTPNGVVMLNVKDPANNFVYEVHQYFNADWTGASADCQSVECRYFDAHTSDRVGETAQQAHLPWRDRRRFWSHVSRRSRSGHKLHECK